MSTELEQLQGKYRTACALISEQKAKIELLDAALEDLINARVVEVSEQFVNVRIMARAALDASRNQTAL